MQAVISAEFVASVPESIRERLNLKAGTLMDFDETAPYLKAVPAGDSRVAEMAEFDAWLASSIGIAKGKLTTGERMRETRGED